MQHRGHVWLFHSVECFHTPPQSVQVFQLCTVKKWLNTPKGGVTHAPNNIGVMRTVECLSLINLSVSITSACNIEVFPD